LELIKGYFGVGNILKRDNYIEYVVTSEKDLLVIVNHFEKFPLITKKWADYQLLKRAFELIKCRQHLTIEGLLKIVTFFSFFFFFLFKKKKTIKIKNLYPFLLRRGDIYIYIK
jgi:hypothetical protein